MITVTCTATDFEEPYEALNGRFPIQMTWPFLVWSAITVGRRDLHDVLQHEEYSLWEMFYRAAIVFANLKANDDNLIVRSGAYTDLDPSEKGAISYFLGMSMAKAFAAIKLGVPWLVHLDVFRDKLGPVELSGRARPDLVGTNASEDWVVVESKGRTNKLEDAVVARAKDQATKLTLVSGKTPCLYMGAVTHFGEGHMQIAVSDPPGDVRAPKVDLKITREEFFERYYANFKALLRTKNLREIERGDIKYQVVGIDALDLCVGLRSEVSSSSYNRTRRPEPPILDSSGHEGEDGVFVELGPLWSPENMRREPKDRRRSLGNEQ